MANLSEYLSVRQFAEKLGLTTVAIRKAIEQNRIKADKMGDYYVIHISQLKLMKSKRKIIP